MVLAIAAGLAIASAFAGHTLGRWRTDSGPLQLTVYTNSAGTAAEQAMIDAVANWNAHPDVELTIVDDQACEIHANAISVCIEDRGPTGGGGAAVVKKKGQRIIFVDAWVNSYYYSNPLPGSDDGLPWYYGTETTGWHTAATWPICHELGHALGLDHENFIHSDPDFANHEGCMNTAVRDGYPSPHDFAQLAAMYGG